MYRDSKRSYGGDRGDRGFKKMFSATCATCGDHCEVPFKPNGRKPVLCSNCFSKDGGGSERRYDRNDRGGNRFERSDAPRSTSSGMSSDQFRTLNEKLDAIIRAIAEM